MQSMNGNTEEPEGQLRRRARFAKPKPNLFNKRSSQGAETSVENSPKPAADAKTKDESERILTERISNSSKNKVNEKVNGNNVEDDVADNDLQKNRESTSVLVNTDNLGNKKSNNDEILVKDPLNPKMPGLLSDTSEVSEKMEDVKANNDSLVGSREEQTEGQIRKRGRFYKPKPNLFAKRTLPSTETVNETQTNLSQPLVGKNEIHDENKTESCINEDKDENPQKHRLGNSAGEYNSIPNNTFQSDNDRSKTATESPKRIEELDPSSESLNKNDKEDIEGQVRKRVRFNKPRPNLLAKRTLPSTENQHQIEANVSFKKPRDVQRVLSEKTENNIENASKNYKDGVHQDKVIEADETLDIVDSEKNIDNKGEKKTEEKIEKTTSQDLLKSPSKILSQNNQIASGNSKQKSNSKASEKKEVTKKHYRIGKNPPERSKMRMYDLIYWNPSNNPMLNEDGEADENVTENEVITENNQPPLNEEAEPAESDNPENEAMPVPQVKIGPDGQIILDEQSLVIETTAAANNKVNDSPVVYEKSSNTTYASFRTKKPTKFWSDSETMKFYKVLSSVGLDFSLMANFFPKRTRRELKLKFKKEDKANKELIDKAISDRQEFNLSLLEEENFNSDDQVDNDTSTKKGRKSTAGRKKKTVSENRVPENTENNSNAKKKGTRLPRRQTKKKAQKRKLSYCSSDTDSADEPSTVNENLLKNNVISTAADKSKETDNPLHFNLDNPTNDKEKQVPLPLNSEKKTTEVSNATVEEKSLDIPCINLENEKDDTDSDVQSVDSELEILKTVQRPTRSGRQPKRPEIFTVDDDDEKKLPKRKPKNSTRSIRPSRVVTSAPPANEELTSQLRNIILQKAPLVSSIRPSQDRLVFVPTSTADENRQIIHVYMLSPCSQNSLPSSSTVVSNTLASPSTIPTTIFSPVRTAIPSLGTNIQSQFQKIRIQPPMKFGQRIIISPVSSSGGIKSPELQTSSTVSFPKSPPPIIRTNTKFQPNIAAAKRVRQTSTSSTDTLDKEILELHINNNSNQETTQTEI